MFKTIWGLGGLLVFILNTQAFAGYSTLKSSRSQIRYPHYSPATKRLVFDQVKLALSEMFVHREIKVRDLGADADPLPKLNDLEKKINVISNAEFHQSLNNIFNSLKDLHTLYNLPTPFSCYESFLPFRFKYIRQANGQKAFAVTDVDRREEVLKLLPKNFKVAPGDLLISYKGLPTLEAVRRAMSKTYGANPEAQFRLAQDDLRYIDHGVDQLPEGDTIDLEFQKSSGQRFKVRLPWITFAYEDCLSSSSRPFLKSKILNRMGSVRGNTREPILYWQINRSEYGIFGYIELISFNPEIMSVDETVLTIRDLLLNELRETDGLMIDLRDNRGGQIPLAEKIIQLFSPKEVHPLQYILRNSETNYVYFKKSDADDPFNALLESARQLGTTFTSSHSISDKEEINDLGQAYFKPVAVFVNSKCYSSCEVFAAQIQDHEVGLIFGEDLQTGGGGANVYNLNKILDEEFAQTDPYPFAKLPAGQDISFSIRQAVRVGKNAGTLIENVGVRADKLAPMSMSDIFNATNDQLLVLQKYLSSVTDRFTSSIYFEHEGRFDFRKGFEANIKATWTDTSTFTFVKDGRYLTSREVDLNSSSEVPLPINVNSITSGKLEILGSNKNRPVWRKIVRYRITPDYESVKENEDLTEKINVYNVLSNLEKGWKKENGVIFVGGKGQYFNNIESEASLFITIPETAPTLTYTTRVQTEKDFDFLNVYAVEEGHAPLLIQSLSGNLPVAEYSIDLSHLSGKDVELRFVFKSDEGTRDTGVSIKNIHFK